MTWLWRASKQWSAILLQFLVLIDHHLVHQFFDNEEPRKSTNPAAVCSEVACQKYLPELIALKYLPNESNLTGFSSLKEFIARVQVMGSTS